MPFSFKKFNTLIPVAAAVTCLLLLTSWAVADANSTNVKTTSDNPVTPVNKRTKNTSTKSTLQLGMTAEREAAALTFVRQYHPQLEELLISLKERGNRGYSSAIRDLFKTSERLAATKERNEEQYEYQLSGWKLKSRLQLLSVQIQMNPKDKKLRAELKSVLTQQVDLQLEHLQSEYKKTALRATKMKEQVDQLAKNRDALINKQYSNIISPPAKSKTSTTASKDKLSKDKTATPTKSIKIDTSNK
ncbi:MAG: hypothetical protein ACKVH8_06905 [Pirellulales bacterium]